MIELNEEQRRAVRHRDGPMLVLAGPGSGKTSVIVSRVLYLIKDEHIDPHNILVLTFSKYAALQMQDRFISGTDISYPVTFGTFHAVFYHILKSQGMYGTGEILTGKRKLGLLAVAVKKAGLDHHDDAERLSRMLELISLRKMGSNELIEDLSDDEKNDLERVYEPYVRLCRNENCIDFDDMINECLKALKGNEKILAKWRKRFRYILVDEFQDIDGRQYEAMRLLAGREGNIFCVGDDDQSIYSFRGADPSVMMKLKTDYPGLDIVNLKTNYRCPPEVILHAKRLISYNSDRFEKDQDCFKKEICGKSPEYKCFGNPQEEAVYCVELIERILENASTGRAASIGVLYRSSRSAHQIEALLRRKGIAYARKDRNDGFYAKEWVRDIIAYLRLSQDDTFRSGDLFRVLNRPYRGLTRESVPGTGFDRGSMLGYYAGMDDLSSSCRKMFDDIDFIRDLDGYGAFNYILKGVGLEKYIRESYFGSCKHEEADHALSELADRARMYKSVGEWLEDIEKDEKRDREEPAVPADVSLMTIHGSKGLEFDNVIMIGLQEGVFPGKRCNTARQMDEERRLFYVAMTRCRERLWLLGIRRDGYGKRASRFIAEAGFDTETVGSII
ncbi:MAG: ATP-dependent helicase [Lachnospiraceae bacterium]|nr:ATP-dependent helicase [Lachnospiraceae bacterium]